MMGMMPGKNWTRAFCALAEYASNGGEVYCPLCASTKPLRVAYGRTCHSNFDGQRIEVSSIAFVCKDCGYSAKKKRPYLTDRDPQMEMPSAFLAFTKWAALKFPAGSTEKLRWLPEPTTGTLVCGKDEKWMLITPALYGGKLHWKRRDLDIDYNIVKQTPPTYFETKRDASELTEQENIALAAVVQGKPDVLLLKPLFTKHRQPCKGASREGGVRG